MYIALTIAIIHWFNDFVLQSHWVATNKSKSWKALLSHTSVYAGMWYVIGTAWSYLFHNGDCGHEVWMFTLVTFIAHTITDYFTSRWTSKLWAKGDVHNFFVVVGFDQVLHYAQLFITYNILFQ